jgi:hypothetical protein
MVMLPFLQRASDRYQAKVSQIDRDKVTSRLLYAIYISGIVCGLIGFSLHFAANRLWCEKLGLIPCFSLLGLCKSFLYLFFLRRAKFAQGILANKCSHWFFTVIAPVYLFFYWMIYVVVAGIVFTGSYSHHATVSNCSVLGEYAPFFAWFSAFVEIVNSVVSIAIFTYPLIMTMYQVQLLGSDPAIMSPSDLETKLQFIGLMKWNVILTLIATSSSVLNLFMILVAGHYIWLFCLGDPFINGLCVFLMIAPNREYIAKMCGCGAERSNKIECDIKPVDTGKTASDTSATNANTVSTVDVVIH